VLAAEACGQRLAVRRIVPLNEIRPALQHRRRTSLLCWHNRHGVRAGRRLHYQSVAPVLTGATLLSSPG